MIAVAPYFAAIAMPSANGKNASDAIAQPCNGSVARWAPHFTESTRLICPAPIPSVRSRVLNTMALDFTCFTTRQPKSMASISSSVGGRFDTVLRSSGRDAVSILVLDQETAADLTSLRPQAVRPSCTSRIRRFLRCLRMASASSM